jgi:hypothetical protein
MQKSRVDTTIQSKSSATLDEYPHVLEWLQQKYHNSIPFFEMNPETLQILSELVKKNNEQNRQTTILISDLKDKTNEYKWEADRIGQIIESAGLSWQQVSHTIQQLVRSFARLASLLEVKDTSTSR